MRFPLRQELRLDLAGEVEVVAEYLQQYHEERNHQGLDNTIIVPGEEVGRTTGPIECRERLGGVLRYYYRQAA